MPYCPKCDMEFVDGITVCTDCGGPLFASEAAWRAEKEREKEEERARHLAERDRITAELIESGELPVDVDLPTGGAASLLSPDNAEMVLSGSAGAPDSPFLPNGKKSVVHPGVYIDASQRYDDTKASASAFYLVGGGITAAAVLCWAGIIPLPLIMKIVLTAIGLGSLAVGLKSSSSAKAMLPEIEKEKERTRGLIQWFTETYSADDLDAVLNREYPELSPEELSLKRYELIQDRLTTSHDLPDPTYVDALAEEIYGRLYGEEE